MSSVSAEQIVMEGSKERPLVLPSWVAAQLSDVWQSIKKNTVESMKRKDKQGRVQSGPVTPASSHNQT
jgi:hypothetical protein